MELRTDRIGLRTYDCFRAVQGGISEVTESDETQNKTRRMTVKN